MQWQCVSGVLNCWVFVRSNGRSGVIATLSHAHPRMEGISFCPLTWHSPRLISAIYEVYSLRRVCRYSSMTSKPSATIFYNKFNDSGTTNLTHAIYGMDQTEYSASVRIISIELQDNWTWQCHILRQFERDECRSIISNHTVQIILFPSTNVWAH